MKHMFMILLLSCYFIFSPILLSQVPRTISYQGILTDTSGVPKPNGEYMLTFRLYNVSSGGTALWQEDRSVQLKKGVFSVLLGEVVAFPNTLDFDQQYWLGVQIAPNQEMSPRTKLTTVPYSFNSVHSDTADYVKNSSTGSVGWVFNKNNLYSTNTGGVGIGTMSPQYKLDVIGPFRATYNASNDIVIQTTGGTNAWAKYWMQTPNQSWSLGTSQNFNSDQFYLADETHAQQRMTIQPNGGSIVFPNNVSNSLILKTTGGTNSWAKYWMQTPNQSWSLGTSQNFNGDQFYLTDETHGGLQRMTIQPNGGEIIFPNNVSNSLGVQTSGGTNAWAKFYVRTTNHTWDLGTSQNFNGDQFYISDASSGGSIRMCIMPNGNVGIGTTNPAYALDIYNPLSSQINLREGISGNNVILSQYTNRFEIQPSNGFQISVGTAAKPDFWVEQMDGLE